MNERIKELAKEAKEYASSFAYAQAIGQPGYEEKFSEKFAELIVRECIERVRSQCIHVRDSTIEGRPNPFFPDLRVRTEYEQGIVKCGVDSVIALEELIQEQTAKWYKENILGDEE
jgi:hypothetical protein